jgi:hypothetical protein
MAKWTIPLNSVEVLDGSPLKDAELWLRFFNRFSDFIDMRGKVTYCRSLLGTRYSVTTISEIAGELHIEQCIRAKVRMFYEGHRIVAIAHVHQLGRFVIKFRMSKTPGPKVTFHLRVVSDENRIVPRQVDYNGLEIESMYSKLCVDKTEESLIDHVFMLSLLS